MDFYEVLDHVLALLQRHGRVSPRALKRQFNIDDDFIADLKDELIHSRHPVVEGDDQSLVWTRDTEAIIDSSPSLQQPIEPSLPQPTSPAETQTTDAERRQLTVMFCDLVDSTMLSSQLDPEDLREVIRAYQTTCTEVIQRYEGHVAQLLGDGLLVYFGYPQAHEDDAQRAIHAGLGMVAGMRQLNQRLASQYQVQLAIRVGVHTGLVVIGEMGGRGRHEQLALGETPNIAARIQGLAEPDTIVMSHATYELNQDYFTWQSLGHHTLRGVAEPVAIYRALQESGVQNRVDAAAIKGLTPLVGREAEVTLLLDRWERVQQDGLGQVVLLSGEAGIGKSRLIQVLKDHMTATSCLSLEGRSSPYYQNTALYPIIELIKRLMQWQPEDTEETALRKLEQTLGRYPLSIEETVPLLAVLLALPLPEGHPFSLNLTPQQQRQKTLDLLVTILMAEAARQPVFLIIEDLHWTDPTTLSFLDQLMTQHLTAALFILLTCRPEFKPNWPHRAHLTEMSLTRLSHHQMRQLAEQVAHGKQLPDDIVRELIAKTDGVPLFLEELTKTVIESNTLQEYDDHYELTSPVATLAIPATLHDSLMARLDRLTSAKSIAQWGAVIGRQFSYDLLQAVSPFDAIILQQELETLIEAELIYPIGQRPRSTYMFKHALIQDTAYQSLLKSTRQQIHQRIAQVLVDQFPETAAEQPELLAHHFTETGQVEQAATYWQQAGERARARAADVEAIAHFQAGLAVLKTQPETPDRMQRELPLYILLALAYTASKGQAVPEVEQAYLNARHLCQRVHDDHQLFRALIGLTRCYGVRSEYQGGEAITHELVQVAERVQDPRLLLEAYMMRSTYTVFDGAYRETLQHCEHALANYDRKRHPAYVAQSTIDPGVNLLSRRSWAQWFLGYPEQALASNQEMLTLARELGHVHSLAMFSNFAALTHQLCGDIQGVTERTQDAMQLALDHDFHQLHVTASMMQGWILASHHQDESGITQMQQGLVEYNKMGIALYRVWYLALLADAYWRHHQSCAGLATITEAMTISRPFIEPELYRLKGELLLMQSEDHQVEATTCFDHALSLARQQSAKSWELRAATSRAHWWQQQGQPDRANELLSPVYQGFTEGLETADLRQAKRLLDELPT